MKERISRFAKQQLLTHDELSQIKSSIKNSKRRLEMPLPDTGYVRREKILQLFPVSRAHWEDGVRKGKYPAPVRVGPQLRLWKVEDIRELLRKIADGELAGK